MHNNSKLFPCDPTKNVMCRKTNCFLYGGTCESTVYRQYMMEDPTMEKLEQMLETQCKFQERLGINFETMTMRERVAFIKEHSIHLNQEINEMLYELPYFKPWKDYTDITEADEIAALCKAQMELVDAWHFFMNILMALELWDEDFFEMYMMKNKENHRRQDVGYTAHMSYRNQTVEEVLFDEQD